MRVAAASCFSFSEADSDTCFAGGSTWSAATGTFGFGFGFAATGLGVATGFGVGVGLAGSLAFARLDLLTGCDSDGYLAAGFFSSLSGCLLSNSLLIAVAASFSAAIAALRSARVRRSSVRSRKGLNGNAALVLICLGLA